MNILQRFGQRWDERDEGLETAMVQSTVNIAADRDAVWRFLAAPESALLVGDSVVKAFRVPRTPEGQPGEQICVVQEEEGRLVAGIVETVTVEPPESLVTRWLTGPSELVEKSTLHTSEHNGTSLTVQLSVRVELGYAKKARPILGAHLERSLRRTRAAIESGARFPSPDDAEKD